MFLRNLKIDVETFLKKGIWLYILLLIFEGALRKWFLPSLATPLLVVRDPIVIILLGVAIYHRLLNWNIYILVMILVSLFAIPATLISGHGSLAVALFGTRYLFLHFAFIFLIGAIFDKSDVEKVGRFLLWLAPFMTILITLQFYSPQSAWVNRGLGGSELGSGFSGAMGFFRPSGVFSFTTGSTSLYSVTAAYLVYFWLSKSQVNRLLLLVASISTLIALPISISRAYLFQFGISIIFGVVVSLNNPKTVGRIIVAGIIMLVGYFTLSQFSFFQTGTEVLAVRFEGANEHEGGMQGIIGNRFFGSLYHSLVDAAEQPILGYGLGLGTNTGQKLLSGNHSTTFISTEGEWGRLISEIGPILGLVAVGIRTSLGFSFLFKSWSETRIGNFLPWMLLSFGFIQLVMGNWAQPTSLGFSIITGGLVLASFSNTPSRTIS